MKFNNAKILIDAQKEVVKLVKESVNVMGTIAVTHFTQNFRRQGFDDKKWKPRKDQLPNGISRLRKRERASSGRAILVKSGALRRSIRYYRAGVTSVIITSPLPYADAHNEGIPGRLPKRQFIGDSEPLNRKILSRLDQRILAIFK